jgi:sugar phosphate isomerase/epimerase
MANMRGAGRPGTNPPITARDAAAVQRLWNERVLSDVDVDRALGELGGLVGQRDEARRLVRRLAEVWPRDALRRAEAFLEETDDEAARLRAKAGR